MILSSMFAIFEIFNLNSWRVLTMRSGGGVLLMKHLIWPFSPCKACCVCVLEIVGGPERKAIQRVIFTISCDIYPTFASRFFTDCSGVRQEHLYWVMWESCWRQHLSITQQKHLSVTGGHKWNPRTLLASRNCWVMAGLLPSPEITIDEASRDAFGTKKMGKWNVLQTHDSCFISFAVVQQVFPQTRRANQNNTSQNTSFFIPL